MKSGHSIPLVFASPILYILSSLFFQLKINTKKYIITMAEARSDDTEPLLKEDKTGGDDDDVPDPPGGNVSIGYDPGKPDAHSSPHSQRQTLLNTHDEIPSFFESPNPPGLSTTINAKNELHKEFPFFDKDNIKFKMENDRLKVGIMSSEKPYYFLLTKVSGKEEYQINKKLPKEILRALGKSRRDTIAEKMTKLTAEIADYKKRAADPNENQVERDKARQYASRKLNERTDLKKELDSLKKGNYQPSENIAMETFNENEAARQQREKEIHDQIEVQETVLNGDDSNPEEKARAAETKRELEQEVNEIENEREGEIGQLRLRDRIREKVKAIFKKYGFTVTAVLLAVGTTIGVVLSSLSNGLKSVANGVGNGFKALGKQLADLLPGLLGAVVSFVFRTAGQVISFLGKHAWLLILAVAAFLFERLMKKKRD